MYMVGIDTGGTFTDMFAVNSDGARRDFKAFTTPDFTEGVLDGLEGLGGRFGISREELLKETELFFFSTTMTTNLVVEEQGARVGALTTIGHRDALHMMGGARGKTAGMHEADVKHSALLDKPLPLVPKPLLREVSERVDYAGRVIVPLDGEGLLAEVDLLVESGIEALAVCFLWSIRNPSHELRARELVESRHPDLAVSLSSEIAPRLGEYPRFATTALNAMCAPKFSQYYRRMVASLEAEGLPVPPLIMQATGGVATPEEAEVRPVLTIGSGPVGGVVGTQALSRSHGFPNVITADMGGTSFDVGLVKDGEPIRVSETTAGRHILFAPVVDVVSIGKGGGSIAGVSQGRLTVGPESAHAVPGPVCYGNGGTRPTITDADLVLGFLNPDYFLGGRVRLDKDAAERAIEEHVAAELGMTTLEAAAGIHDIASAHMADLIRKKTVETGYDPRDFALYAFGGAGPVHAHSFAQGLGLSEIVIPLGDVASVYSAYGVLSSDVSHTYERPQPAREPFDFSEFAAVFGDLERAAVAQLEIEGFSGEEVALARHFDMKYSGQLYEIEIAVPGELDEAGFGEKLTSAFTEKYEELYGAGAGFLAAGLEVTNFRLRALGRTKPVPAFESGTGPAVERHGSREVYWPHERALLNTATYRPGPDQAVDVSGPAILELADTSIPVPPGSQARSLEDGSIVIRFEEMP
jgi:N-methylhydantoinase A